MKIESVVLVLFFAVALQSSRARETYSSSQCEIESDFSTIESSEKRALRANDKACNILFQVITEFVYVSLGIKNKINYDLSEPEDFIDGIYHQLSNGLAASVYAIQVIQPDTSEDPTRWDLVRSKLKSVVVNIKSAILLSIDSGSRSQIDEIETEVINRSIEICETLYNAMAIGRFNETDVINALGAGQAKAISDVRIIFRAIFNAVKILFEINASEIHADNEQILSSIEYLRTVVLEFQRIEIRNRYDLIYSIRSIDVTDQFQIATYFSTLQTKENEQYDCWSVVLDYIWNILYEIDGRKIISFTIEEARSKILESLEYTFVATKYGFEIIQNEKSRTIVANDKSVYAKMTDVVEGIFDALEKTQCSDSSGVLNEINAIEKTVVSAILSVMEINYETTVRISSTRIDVTAAIESVQEITTDHMEFAIRTIFDEFRFIIAAKSADIESGSTSLFFGLDTRSVIFTYLELAIELNSELFRKLCTLNYFNDYGISVEYKSVAIMLPETQQCTD